MIHPYRRENKTKKNRRNEKWKGKGQEIKEKKKKKLTSMTLASLAISPISAVLAISKDCLAKPDGAGLVDIVVVANTGIPVVVGDPAAIGGLSPGESTDGSHGQSEAGGDDDASDLHGELGVVLVWRSLRSDVLVGSECCWRAGVVVVLEDERV